jgi:hypothetical protein
MVGKCLLERMQRAVAAGQAFDGGDFMFVSLHRQHQAGSDRAAVKQHRTGSADAVLAAEMRAGQTQLVAQKISERGAHVDRFSKLLPVDDYCDATLVHGNS